MPKVLQNESKIIQYWIISLSTKEQSTQTPGQLLLSSVTVKDAYLLTNIHENLQIQENLPQYSCQLMLVVPTTVC